MCGGLHLLWFCRLLETASELNLTNLFQGKESAKKVKALCPNESIQRKIFNAVDTLRNQASSKRAEFELKLVSPSDFAKRLKYESHINDGRHSTSLHVGLQFRAFGKFVDIANNRHEQTGTGMHKYYELAHCLMQKMSDIFDNGCVRLCVFEDVIHLHNMCNLEIVITEHAKSDCLLVHEVSGTKHVLVNFELKNELCFGHCPNRQNIGHFMNFQAGQAGRSPMLLVSLADPHYFQVFGAVWNGDEVCVDPLSDPISLLSIPRDPRCGGEKLARVLAAINYTVEELKDYYKRQEDESTGGIKGPYPLDGIYDCKKFGDCEWLFEAKHGEDDISVCVKFVWSHYGYAVHKFLADNNLAPKLYSNNLALPGGWFAVIMEKVKGYPVKSNNDLTCSQKQSLQYALHYYRRKTMFMEISTHKTCWHKLTKFAYWISTGLECLVKYAILQN